jgi:hypothetical protein
VIGSTNRRNSKTPAEAVRNFARGIALLAAGTEAAMQCMFCGRPIKRDSAWRAGPNHFYCSEFCAEAELEKPAAQAPANARLRPRLAFQKAQMDRRYIERLQRLLPLRRSTVLPAA